MDLCNINELINSLSMFHKLSDIVRIIHPISKQVIYYDRARKGCDWIGRYGGEEFLITLIGADSDVAYKISESIRSALESKIIKYNSHEIGITISIGVYTIDPKSECFDEVISAVDKNLYKAKRLGKNRTIAS